MWVLNINISSLSVGFKPTYHHLMRVLNINKHQETQRESTSFFEVKGYLRALRQIYAKSSEKCLATGRH